MADNHIFPFLWMRGERAEIIREELGKIAECGIHAVCVEARPHDDFCKDGWWRDLGIVMEEAKRREMQVWILDDKHFPTGYANGLIEEKYPERKKLYLAAAKSDIYGAARTVTLDISRMLKPAIGYWEIGQFLSNTERQNNTLVSITAVRCAEGMELHEECIDLMPYFDGKAVTFPIPGGAWRVFVLYKTRTDGGNESYINMIDKVSAHTQIEAVYEPHFEHFGAEFGKTIAGFFSDEPQFGNLSEMCYDAKLGKKRMNLPWSDELEAMLRERYGAQLDSLLPFLFAKSADDARGKQIRYDYMDCASRLYQQNFCDALGAWCEAHGVEYIGHVVEDNGLHSRFGMGAAHYFRATAGQHMAGIDCIGGQIVYGGAAQGRLGMGESGGDGEFYHYTLGKLGASAGHLDPKKHGRTMCELFGAYGWSFGVRDMKVLLDHLLTKGINYLVPHAFSMAEYPDHDCPPHFYARGHNPQFSCFAKLMHYADRMCRLLSGGQHVASVAVLYDGEADWVGDNMPMQKVCRALIEQQIDFDIVPVDMLADLKACRGSLDGNTLSINGVQFSALIVPQTDAIPASLADFIRTAGSFPVLFVNELPKQVLGGGDVPACDTVALSALADSLRERGFAELTLDRPFAELSFYHYRTVRDIWVFLNESAERAFSGTVTLPGSGELLVYDAMDACYLRLPQRREGDTLHLELELAPAESLVLVENRGETISRDHLSFTQQLSGCRSLDISEGWTVSAAKAGEVFSDEESADLAQPYSDKHPAFSGTLRYRRTLTLDAVPAEAYFRAESVYELLKVSVNGNECGFRLQPPYQLALSGLHAGENELIVEVTTTPARDAASFPQPPFDFQYDAFDATGMFGKLELLIK